MARRQYTVVFTCDSAKLGDALAELKMIGVENLGFDLLQANSNPIALAAPGAKPTRSAVVTTRGPKRPRTLPDGQRVSDTVVEFLSNVGRAAPKTIARYLMEKGLAKGKGPYAIAPTLAKQGRLLRIVGPEGAAVYEVNTNYVPKRTYEGRA
jgi:hypothetical protein